MDIRKLFIFLLFCMSHTYGGAQEAVNNSGNFHNAGANIAFFSDVNNTGTWTASGGTTFLSGTSLQNVTGTAELENYACRLNNSAGVKLDNQLKITDSFIFFNGILFSDRTDFFTEFVHFDDGATYVGASNSSHIDGVVRKTGNDSFTFPLGDSSQIQPILISAPSLVTDAYTAYYLEENPDPLFDTESLEIDCFTPGSTISTCEYWRLERSSGTSDVEVDLTWDVNSCGVVEPCELVVSRWSGSQWVSEGNGGVSVIVGPAEEGTLKSGNGCGSCGSATDVAGYGYYTFGSFTTINPLPITLLYFKAEEDIANNSVLLEWGTASEINNDYFVVERSRDAINWQEFQLIDGAGNSAVELYYKTDDYDPYEGISYYRLKQVDFDGTYTYSPIETVNFNEQSNAFLLFPNPARDVVQIQTTKTISEFVIYDASGRTVFQSEKNLKIDHLTHNLAPYSSGLYLIDIYYTDDTNQLGKMTITKN